MRILHLTTFLQGGAGRVITDLALEQQRGGHDVRVMASLTEAAGYGNYQAYLDELQAAAVPVRLVDSTFLRQHAPNLAVATALDSWYSAGAEPDVIHSHAAVPGLVGLVFNGARRTSAAMVQTMHGWGQMKDADQVATDIAVLNLMDRVAVASRHSVETLMALGVAPARIERVPYGVRSEGVPPEARDADLIVRMQRARRRGALVVACVGTIGARKNQALLVNALALLADTPVLCVFIGDGDVNGLRKLVRDAGVESSVHIHGYSHAARRLAASADLLVLPSRSEGQPISVLEAFSDGVLVAVSDIPELTELVDDQTGFRFEAESASALARTLRTVCRLPNSVRRSIRGHAQSRYLARFTVDAMAGEYLRLYRAAATARGANDRGASAA